MSHEPLSDPTAGQRAQRARLDPGLPQPILDPTDPRYGLTATPRRGETSDERRQAAASRRPRDASR